jgi:hypothetical protein
MASRDYLLFMTPDAIRPDSHNVSCTVSGEGTSPALCVGWTGTLKNAAELSLTTYSSKLPNCDPGSNSCQPSSFLTTDWGDDRVAGYGSLTSQPRSRGDSSQYFEALRMGMGEGRGIWFAGEHTSPPGGVGTLTGAYWSGEEVAWRVVIAERS